MARGRGKGGFWLQMALQAAAVALAFAPLPAAPSQPTLINAPADDEFVFTAPAPATSTFEDFSSHFYLPPVTVSSDIDYTTLPAEDYALLGAPERSFDPRADDFFPY